MSGDGTRIVSVSAGYVDTEHLAELGAALKTAMWQLTQASGRLSAALALATAQVAADPWRYGGLPSTIGQLLWGGTSVASVSGELADLTRTLLWVRSHYLEAEQSVATQFGRTPPGVTSFGLSLPQRAGVALLHAGSLALQHWLAPWQPRGSATQSGLRSVATLLDLRTPTGRYLTANGPADPLALTPVQRAALTLSHATGLDTYDGGVAVRLYASRTLTLGGADPQAVPVDVDTLMIDGTRTAHQVVTATEPLGYPSLGSPLLSSVTFPTQHPASVNGIVTYVASTLTTLDRLSASRQRMMIQIDSIRRGDGGTSYVVHIPGTSARSRIFTANPASHDQNVPLVAGLDTDVQRSVRSAMRMAGVPAGADVVLTGHSQGGIAAMALASEGDFTDTYHVTHVVTFGSPVAGARVDPEIDTLHFEDADDVVPGLDGAANHHAPNQITVSFTTSPGLVAADGVHSMTNYAKGMRAALESHHPDLAQMRLRLSEHLGMGTESTASSRVFEVQRSVHGLGAARALSAGRMQSAADDVGFLAHHPLRLTPQGEALGAYLDHLTKHRQEHAAPSGAAPWPPELGGALGRFSLPPLLTTPPIPPFEGAGPADPMPPDVMPGSASFSAPTAGVR
ncbi:MAG: hypothetical protein Q4P36_08620 [Bowdeniella nasicola]|nr:hypothetical protein [Bowdeniella nasicola]